MATTPTAQQLQYQQMILNQIKAGMTPTAFSLGLAGWTASQAQSAYQAKNAPATVAVAKPVAPTPVAPQTFAQQIGLTNVSPAQIAEINSLTPTQQAQLQQQIAQAGSKTPTTTAQVQSIAGQFLTNTAGTTEYKSAQQANAATAAQAQTQQQAQAQTQQQAQAQTQQQAQAQAQQQALATFNANPGQANLNAYILAARNAGTPLSTAQLQPLQAQAQQADQQAAAAAAQAQAQQVAQQQAAAQAAQQAAQQAAAQAQAQQLAQQQTQINALPEVQAYNQALAAYNSAKAGTDLAATAQASQSLLAAGNALQSSTNPLLATDQGVRLAQQDLSQAQTQYNTATNAYSSYQNQQAAAQAAADKQATLQTAESNFKLPDPTTYNTTNMLLAGGNGLNTITKTDPMGNNYTLMPADPSTGAPAQWYKDTGGGAMQAVNANGQAQSNAPVIPGNQFAVNLNNTQTNVLKQNAQQQQTQQQTQINALPEVQAYNKALADFNAAKSGTDLTAQQSTAIALQKAGNALQSSTNPLLATDQGARLTQQDVGQAGGIYNQYSSVADSAAQAAKAAQLQADQQAAAAAAAAANQKANQPATPATPVDPVTLGLQQLQQFQPSLYAQLTPAQLDQVKTAITSGQDPGVAARNIIVGNQQAAAQQAGAAQTASNAMSTIASDVKVIPGGSDLIGQYTTPEQAIANAQSAYQQAQAAYDNYKGGDPAQAAQLATALTNAAQLNHFISTDLASSYPQASQNLSSSFAAYINSQNTYAQAQNTLATAQQIAAQQANQAAQNSGGFLNDIGHAFSSLTNGISNAFSSLGSFVDHNIPGGWATIGGAALLAVGITDPELLGAANSGTLTSEQLTAAGVDPATVSTNIANAVTDGSIAPNSLGLASAPTVDTTGTITTVAENGATTVSVPTGEVTTTTVEGAVSPTTASGITALPTSQVGALSGTAGATETGAVAPSTSIFSGTSINPITNVLTNSGITSPIVNGALTGATTTAGIDLLTGKPITGQGLALGALGGGVAGGVGSALPNPGDSLFAGAVNGAATNVAATTVVNLATGQPITAKNLASEAALGGAIGAGAQMIGSSNGTTTYKYEDGSTITTNSSGNPVSVTDSSGATVALGTHNAITGLTTPAATAPATTPITPNETGGVTTETPTAPGNEPVGATNTPVVPIPVNSGSVNTTTPIIPNETGGISVTLPDGSIGSYDPKTGTVYNNDGSVNQTATNMGQSTTNTASNNPSSTVAGPMRVDMSGIAYDANTPPPQGTQLPAGTQLAQNGEEGAYFDTGTSTWVMPIPNQGVITQPVVPVETTPTAPVTTVEVGGPPVSNTGEPGTEPTNGEPTNVVAGTTAPVAPISTPTTPLTGGGGGVTSIEPTAPGTEPIAAQPVAPVSTPTTPLTGGGGGVTSIAPTAPGTEPIATPVTGQPVAPVDTSTNPGTGGPGTGGGTSTTTTGGPGTGGGTSTTTTGGPGGTTTTEPPPLSPIVPTNPGTSPPVTTVEINPPPPTVEPTVPPPVEPPYVAPPIYVPPIDPNTPALPVYGPLDPIKWGTVGEVNSPGLNPGYLMGRTPAQYAGTATQATHYWGQHPYVTDLAHISDYNNIPAGQAWGAQYAAGVGPNRLDIKGFIQQTLGAQAQAAAMGTAYPGMAPGPIAPTK